MRGHALKARRARNLELAKIDALNRCVICRRNLKDVPVIQETFLGQGKCCSAGCLDELIARNK